MSNEIKVGDKVRVREDAPRLYTDGWSCNWLDCDVYVTKIDGDAAEVRKICDDDEWYYLNIPLKYLVKVEGEAKEPKFKVGDYVRYKGGVHKVVATAKDNRCYLNKILGCIDESDLEPYTEPTEQTEAEEPNHTIKIPVEVDLTDSYWDSYSADLAKEIALKVANKYNDPKETAEYAVSVAKAVAEGLKKK